jgi:hypothetical protein
MDDSSRHGWRRYSSSAALNGPRGVGSAGGTDLDEEDMPTAGVLVVIIVILFGGHLGCDRDGLRSDPIRRQHR